MEKSRLPCGSELIVPLLTLIAGGLAIVAPCPAIAVQASTESATPGAAVDVQAVIATATPVAITFMLSVLVMKVTAFVLGYLIVKLGHDTLIKGVTGEIDFGFSGSGFKAKLKAASPGGLFVLLGAAIIIWGLVVQKPMDIAYRPGGVAKQPATSQTSVESTSKRPKVPD